MNETSEHETAPGRRTHLPRRPWGAEQGVLFWFLAWLATAIAGGFYGLRLGGPVGFLIGVVLAGMIGAPVHGTVAVITWVAWLSRLRIVAAALAGALTGIAATHIVLSPRAFSYTPSKEAALAAVLGAVGAVTGGGFFWALWEKNCPRDAASADGKPPVWQFTLRDLLLRVTVIAMLLSAWTWAFAAIRNAREEAWQRQPDTHEQREDTGK